MTLQHTRTLDAHLAASQEGLASLAPELDRIQRWGDDLRRRLERGARLLIAGNGGSAALAHHVAGEMVGRFDRERAPFSALALSGDPAGVTAIGNDYGYAEVFARQVHAHGRQGDVLLALSTSGRSPNLLRAVDVGRRVGMTAWALTGPAPNPLAEAVDDVVAVPCPGTPSVQDVHQVAVHLLCVAFENAADRW
jgi:D-sedoheptulose 7-phosphate isomerase